MDPPIVSPIFTKRTLLAPTFLSKNEGDTLELYCMALGSPSPLISWLYNEKPLFSGSSLVVEKLQGSQSGTYTCLATNLAGTVNHQFSVTVRKEKLSMVERPDVNKVENASVLQGDTSNIQCKVKSRLKPSIQWLKKTNRSESIKLANMKVVNVGNGKTVKVGDGVYSNTYVIKSVTLEDKGVYVCFATNSAGGFNYELSHLTVLPQKDNFILPLHDHNILLGLVVGLGFVAVLMVSVLFFIKLRNKSLGPEYSEPHKFIVYQNNNLDHRGWASVDDITWSTPKRETIISHKYIKNMAKDLSHQDCSSNIYDLPLNQKARSIPNKMTCYTPVLQITH